MFTPPTVNVTVMVEAATEMLTAEIFPPFAADGIPTPALNRQPLGAVRMRVFPEPTAKSPFAPSVMTILPNVVKADAAPLVDLSAERFVPAVAAVTVTLASTRGVHKSARNKTNVEVMRARIYSNWL